MPREIKRLNLPDPARAKNARCQASLTLGELSGFFASVRAQNGTAARALEFAILTACRTGEVLGAKWSELDMEDRTWVIPPERMKAGRTHRVPLSPAALSILNGQQGADAIWIFPDARPGNPLGAMAFLILLRRMNRKDILLHGFRSSFRDWAAQQGAFSEEVAKLALAHTVGGTTANGTRHGDLFEKHRQLMDAWALCCLKLQ